MKKLFFLFLMSVVCMFANAEEITSDDYSLYLEDATVQVGTSVDVYVKIKFGDRKVGAAQFKLKLPEGVTVEDFRGFNGTAATEAGDADSYYVLGGCQGLETVGVFTLNVSEDAETGIHTILIPDFKMADYDTPATKYVGENITSTLTVQKSAVLEPQNGDFAFDILPAQISSATTYLPILMKNKLDVASYTLEVTYPTGITPKSGRGVAPKVVTDNLYSTTDPSIQALSVTQTISGQVAKYTVSNSQTDTYMAKEDYYEVLQVPVTVSSTDAICNVKVKVSDIVAYDAKNDVNLETPINIEGGEFMTTLIIGYPSVQEAILYGHYNEATASAFTTALKNVAIADVTAATVDDGVKFTDVLVNEKGGNSYYTRTSANYGTTVLPLDLTTEKVDKLYTVESMDANSIVIAEAEQVPANTPCIFKGTINVEGATPILGDPSEQTAGSATFKGTYQSMYLEPGAGYYISSNGKFYNDGASVRPFRGYFEGNVSGVKSLSVLIDTPDGLKDITDQFSKEDIYNLQGIRMNNVQKGINIKGGKKVLVK